MEEMMLAAWALVVAAPVRARRAMVEKRMVKFLFCLIWFGLVWCCEWGDVVGGVGYVVVWA